MTRRLILALLLAVIGVSGLALAQEKAVLTTAQTYPSNTGYTVQRLTLDYQAGTILIQLTGDNGEALSCLYSPQTTPTGTTLLTALNKANLASAFASNATTGTLNQRIFYRLVTLNEAPTVCGKSLAGTIGGSIP